MLRMQEQARGSPESKPPRLEGVSHETEKVTEIGGMPGRVFMPRLSIVKTKSAVGQSV